MAVKRIPADYVPRLGLLRERVILVTGAGAGLGRALALACGGLGATVVLLGRTVAALEATYDAIVAAGGAQPAIYPMHLAGASAKDYDDLAVALQSQLGRLDGVAHCAAHFSAFMPLAEVPPQEWVESLQVNLTAPWALTRACLPLLAAAADASVVFVTCAAAREARAYQGAYGVAKAGVEAVTRMWAAELEKVYPRLRFNSYDPGPMRTQLRRRGYPHDDSAPLAESAVPGLLWLLGPDSDNRGQYT